MKLKFVATAAVALMLAAPAFAVTDFDPTDAVTAIETEALAVAEFGTVALSGDGNVALINQESSGNIAFISQTGATNFAAIVQTTNDGAIATIYQIGDSNRAAVIQN